MINAVFTILSLIIIFGAGWLCWCALQVIERLGLRAIDKMRGISPEDRTLRREEKLLQGEKNKLAKAEQTKAVREDFLRRRKAIQQEMGLTRTVSIFEGWASIAWVIFMAFLLFKLIGYLGTSERHMESLMERSGHYSAGKGQ
ncbi:MAG: hypothetical protein IPJ01_07675 [Micavibrio sp.]|jgi:ABC-type nickel/cobalt efflux system permease component RcnA|nr:hypothetical protein [Micavibrio sp.]MBP7720976.1 hypothetical protein [Alphaproteobacteria bacterium]